MRYETVVEQFLFDNKKKMSSLKLFTTAVETWKQRSYTALIQHHEELGIPAWLLITRIRLASLVKATGILKSKGIYIPPTFYRQLQQKAFQELKRSEIQKYKEWVEAAFPSLFDSVLKGVAYV